MASGRFVLLSDLHAHMWSAFAKGDGRDNSRLRRSLLILAQSLEKARELRIPWVFGGDIVHTAGYTLNVVLAELTHVLVRYSDVVKLAVWGNHDARGVGGKISIEQTVLATLNLAVPNLFILDPSTLSGYKDTTTGLTFSGAGYQPRHDLLEYAEPSDVGIYHQTVRGTKAPNGFVLEEGIAAEELLKRHRFTAVGHVHHWQYVPHWNPERVVMVPGSPEHHNFGDMGEHGWWVVTIGKELLEVEFTPGGSPEFRTVDVPADVKNDGHFYRVRSIPAGSSLPSDAIAIAPAPTTVENRDMLRGARGDQTLSVWLKAEPVEASIGEAQYLAVGRALLGAQDVGNLRAVRLVSLNIKNFCSYQDQFFDVHPGTWLVLGQGRDFPSNGAGKSTLFEAIQWCLFGRTTKGLTGDEVIRWGEDACEVSLTFQEGDQTTTVTRTRGAASRLVVITPEGLLEGKSVNEVTEKLEKYLGLTPELYQALAYFSQERLLLFASATDGERKDMLADLIGLSAYQEASSAAAKEADTQNIALQKVVALRDAAERNLAAEKQRLVGIQAQAEAWATDRSRREQVASAALAQFGKERAALHDRMMQEARTSLGRTLTQRKGATADELRGVQDALAAPQPATNTPQELIDAQLEHSRALAEVKSIRGLLEETERQRANLKRRLQEQEKVLAAGKCPSCGQDISAEHSDKCLAPARSDVAEVERRSAELQEQQAATLPQAVLLQQRVLEVTQGVEAGRRLEKLQSDQARLLQTLAEIAKEEEQVEASAKWHVDKTLTEHRADLERVVDRIRAERNPHEGEERGTQERIAAAELEVTHRSEERVRILREICVYDYWRRGFSKQGIQSLLVDEVAALFNSVRGEIFPSLTQGVYDVQFSTMSQTKAGEWREKTDFQIFERGQLVPYSALSGGQRRRVDVGVMLTLVKAVSRWMQVPGVLGLLVLDEVFGFLDGSGAEGLMEALREVQQQIPAIFVVSHEPQLQALFPEVVVVAQGQDGISSIVAGPGE